MYFILRSMVVLWNILLFKQFLEAQIFGTVLVMHSQVLVKSFDYDLDRKPLHWNCSMRHSSFAL